MHPKPVQSLSGHEKCRECAYQPGSLTGLFKTVNSIVLSLPKDVLDDFGIKDGESVHLELDREQRRVIITPVEKPIAVAGVHADFARQVAEFIQQYRPALKELAK